MSLLPIFLKLDGRRGLVVLAVAGDMVLLSVFAARERLEAEGFGVRIVALVNPRQLYRARDVAADTVAEPDLGFMGDKDFARLFDGDRLVAISGGPSGPLEPVLMRAKAPLRATLAWRRGDTTATPAGLLSLNGLDADTIVARVLEMDE